SSVGILVIHNLKDTKLTAVFSVPQQKRILQLVGISQEDRALYWDMDPPRDSRTIQILEQDLVDRAPALPERSILLPFQPTVLEIAVSPRGDSIAWLLEYQEDALIDSWMNRIYRAFQRQPRWRVGLWTSRIDGADMREVGHTGAPPDGQPYVINHI